MPDSYKIIDSKKFMWDGKIYETEEEAKSVAESYQKDNFETRIISEEGKYLVYNRREVKEVK
jgi:hypothetical protein